MIFWMRRFARSIAADLRGRLEDAVGLGAVAVVAMAFLAVVREGLETALLFFAAAQGASSTVAPLLGLLAGIGTVDRARLAHLRRRDPDQPVDVLHAGPARC